MESRQVKEIKEEGMIRTTYFTDDTKLVEQLFDGVLVDGKAKSRVVDNSVNQNVSLGFDVKVEGVDKPFSSLVYENYLNKVRETNPDAFGEGDNVVVALSVAKDKEGNLRKYTRLSLPKVVTANDVFGDNLIDDSIMAQYEEAEETANAESKKTTA